MWQTPTTEQALCQLLLGGLATAGQMLLTRGMACAPASSLGLGPFTFFAVVFGALPGWLFRNEALAWPMVAGTLLVTSSATLAGRGMAHNARSPAPAGA